MKKSIFITVLAVIIAICSFGLFACSDGSVSTDKAPGLYEKVYDGDDYYTVYDYVAEDNKTTLDLSANTEIGRIQTGAFDGNDTITEIILPSSIVKIDQGAFKGMKKLAKLTVPFIGSTVNSDAFYGETAGSEDKSVEFARTLGYLFGADEYTGGIIQTQNVNASTTETYYAPETLKEITVTAKENYDIPMYAFSGSTLITTVKLNDKVVSIGESAFEGCTYLENVTAPSVTTIYKKAFFGCTEIESLDAFASVTAFGESAFENTAVKAVTLKAGVTYATRAFAGSKVNTVIVETNVPYACFYGCTKLNSVTINADVSIANYAFAELGKELTINKSSFIVTTAPQWNGGNDGVKLA